MRMAVDRVNRAGGIHGNLIRLHTMDIQDDPALYRMQLKAALDSGYSTVIIPFRSRFANVSLEFADKPNVLLINATMTADKLYNRPDALINLSPSAGSQGRELAQYLIRKNIKSVWILIDESNADYTHDVYQGLVSVLRGTQCQWSAKSLSGPMAGQLEVLADTVARSNPGAVVMILSGADGGIFSQYVRIKEYSGLLLGARWTTTGELIERGGSAVEGFVAATTSMKQTELRQQFDREYKQLYGRIPSFAAHVGYDLVTVLVTGFQQSQRWEPHLLKDYLIQANPVQGISGDIDFDSNGDLTRSSVLTQVRQGAFMELE